MTDPRWLTNLEESAQLWKNGKHEFMEIKSEDVIALYKLVRKLGTAIDRYLETGRDSVLIRADQVYQCGPVVSETPLKTGEELLPSREGAKEAKAVWDKARKGEK